MTNETKYHLLDISVYAIAPLRDVARKEGNMASNTPLGKRAGKILNEIFAGANDAGFTEVSPAMGNAIEEASSEDITRVVRVLEMQGFVEANQTPNGFAVRLTQSGVDAAQIRAGGE